MSAGKELPNESDREFYETSRGETIHAFFEGGTYKVAQALDRNGLVPPPDIVILDPKMLTTEEDVAQMLAEVQVEDPHFQKIDPKTDEGQLDLGILQKAKGEAVIDQKPGLRTKIRNFTNKVLDEIIDRIGGDYDPKRRKFITRTLPITGLALAMTACAPNIVGSTPTATDSGPGKSTATATAPATETAAATATQSPAPTEVPATATREVPQIQMVENVPLDAYEINADLSNPEKLPAGDWDMFGKDNARFATWVFEANNAGLLGKPPEGSVPLSKILPATQADMNKWGKYSGGADLYYITNQEYSDISKRPIWAAAAWKMPDHAYTVLIGTGTSETSSVFGLYTFFPSTVFGEQANGSYDWQLAYYLPGSQKKYVLLGMYFVKDSGGQDGCRKFLGFLPRNPASFCSWYRANEKYTNPQEFVQNWGNGNPTNSIKEDGKLIPYVPFFIADGKTQIH